jgi:hypothetical protein
MEGRDLKVHGKENWRVHGRGRNRRVFMERGKIEGDSWWAEPKGP